MTNLQFGTLRYIRDHEVSVDELRSYNLVTFGSLLRRGWVTRKGQRIMCTREGEDAYALYHYSTCNYRSHAGELTDRVRLLLHISDLRMVKSSAA